MRQLFRSGTRGVRDCGLDVSIAGSPEETERFDGQLAERHYLGAGRPVGDYLHQVEGNQPRLLQEAQAVDALPDTLCLPKAKSVMAESKPAGSMPSPSNLWPPTSPFPAA
ncbi:MAG: hypothetical protein PHP75_06025 [Methylacidiphilaceae bacterium]|nr:hypothetical protein [Candidatus Methylacidiphilaceae bacterium]